MIWEMITRQIPFSDKDSWAIPGFSQVMLKTKSQVAVSKGERPPLPKELHPVMANLIKCTCVCVCFFICQGNAGMQTQLKDRRFPIF